MNITIDDLIRALRAQGMDARINRRQKTVDITAVDREPILDPWALQITADRLRALATSIGEATSAKPFEVLEDIAARVRGDVRMYPPDRGPFVLNETGEAVPQRVRES